MRWSEMPRATPPTRVERIPAGPGPRAFVLAIAFAVAGCGADETAVANGPAAQQGNTQQGPAPGSSDLSQAPGLSPGGGPPAGPDGSPAPQSDRPSPAMPPAPAKQELVDQIADDGGLNPLPEDVLRPTTGESEAQLRDRIERARRAAGAR